MLISVRADSYADCLRYRSLRAALQASPVLLDPMTAAELRKAVLFPAQDVGLEVEPGLIEVLLRDARWPVTDSRATRPDTRPGGCRCWPTRCGPPGSSTRATG